MQKKITILLQNADRAPLSDRKTFYLLQIFRVILSCVVVGFICTSINFGTSSFLLLAATVSGTLLAGQYLLKGKNLIRLTLMYLCTAIAMAATFWFANHIAAAQGGGEPDLSVFRFAEHFWLIASFYLSSFYLTWAFWYWRSWLTIEAVFFTTCFVLLLSAHQNYQLDAPKNIVKLAWENGISPIAPQHFLLGLGVCFSIVLVTYIALGQNRQIFGNKKQVIPSRKTRTITWATASALILIFFTSLATYINSAYSKDLSRASNGVGTNTNEQGQSPLGFHSATGKTRQPSALVRLESSYEDNPWAPMLYFREGALSTYAGRELVVASQEFDEDVPRVSAGQAYINVEGFNKDNRKKIVQAMYLLTDHNSAFAIDQPHSIRLIKNPDEDRFKMAYQAISYAPTTKLDLLIGQEVGSKEWDEKTWQHYLRAPGSKSDSELGDKFIDLTKSEPIRDEHGEDQRYRVMAKQLTEGATSPVEKALKIVNFLSVKSLYTRKPGHTTTQTGDPVAPYLFSEEMRGYCVHFAHSAVYMFRLLGIPARIGTGYLTDLTYAKDGHILLHLGDRHAWPEIYVEGIGWTVVDITPQNAEGDELIIPDENLLEELMGKIDPTDELMDEDLIFDEPETSKTAELLQSLLSKTNLSILLSTMLTLFILSKLYLRHAWRFAGPNKQVPLAYISVASSLADLGHTREHGETRKEFAERLEKSQLHSISSLQERSTYKQANISDEEVKSALTNNKEQLSAKQKLFRALAFFNPKSLFNISKY